MPLQYIYADVIDTKKKKTLSKRYHVQVRNWTDVDAKRLARRFKFICQRDIMPKETISWHFLAHDACQHHSGMNADAHLMEQ